MILTQILFSWTTNLLPYTLEIRKYTIANQVINLCIKVLICSWQWLTQWPSGHVFQFLTPEGWDWYHSGEINFSLDSVSYSNTGFKMNNDALWHSSCCIMVILFWINLKEILIGHNWISKIFNFYNFLEIREDW